ncbi:Cyclic di-GMP phosphodiesterase Gmr [Thalassovita gelatinovora]|uniref:Cyclic di-GMP phosphodiesterase Gmr n=1 Tax=Thalassovita gelatinovora TaxID=53501 RepID=A0A0P1FH44_THAGE|nr:EAL domain-containing protein [Thalassovita gelatinovora]QIZ81905.1 EAL domain-containing protein [Thalassovita gelatinovora]CUH67259.1 Cyclic di-GMP phosphodiesterase Gmr [Thalassovita gelatinovora]SEP77505.1 EAL domain, c-di-GMP-specific phosphodiesterase class I (or its enzymatically inactive variant) [Thalassovita gelatinovora]
MADRKFGKMADIPDGQDSALSYAVFQRDRNVLEMVRNALHHNEAALAFQPVVEAGDPSRVAFYEGLMRIFDDTERVIPARDFMDHVEDTEVGRMIDCVALEQGLHILADHPHIRLSVNMSLRSAGYPRWMETLDRGLTRDPTVGERLILEISEASAMMVPELVTPFMDHVRRKNVAFALDDFGAGITSLSYLREFGFDILKINGDFCRAIHRDPDNQVLIAALQMIAQHFDMLTVACGIETRDEAAWLSDHGIDCLQGHLFGVPRINMNWRQDQIKAG